MEERPEGWAYRLASTAGLTSGNELSAGGVLFVLGAGIVAAALGWWLLRITLGTTLREWKRSGTQTMDLEVMNSAFLNRLAFFLPLVVFGLASEAAFEAFPAADVFVGRTLRLIGIVNAVLVVFALLTGIRTAFADVPSLRDKPINSYVQVGKIIVGILAALALVATLSGQSVGVILGSLGAATAVILLVFRDALLGLTASVQMSTGDLVRLGDWVELAKFGADGTVVEINLTSVKVQNWDLTYTVIPAYAVISESFKNWRGMQEGEGRRIKRHLLIRSTSITFASEELIASLAHIPLFQDWLLSRRAEIELSNAALGTNSGHPLHGRRMTNLGLFRNYATAYLKNQPRVNADMPLLVRQLQATTEGLPLEVYCFSKDKEWDAYETLQADIFDHLFAALPLFQLEATEGFHPREGR
ncbi:MAG: mechanosensitive ion channel family protein [Flavobacteriales bacterium]